jgi:hypothetical protein
LRRNSCVTSDPRANVGVGLTRHVVRTAQGTTAVRRIDPLRFRANLYIDGARPWEEFDWVGRDIKIGGVAFSVDRKNGRCGATNVNPVTGQRDLDIPGSLRAAFGAAPVLALPRLRDGKSDLPSPRRERSLAAPTTEGFVCGRAPRPASAARLLRRPHAFGVDCATLPARATNS